MAIETPFVVQAGISAAGIGIQLYIAWRSRQQSARQSQDTLDMQRLVSHRSTASFVADKRQRWIDELRTDMAFHLALSQEIVWKWDALRDRTALKVSQEANGDPAVVNRIEQEAADAFTAENGARDREHHERHIRLKFRLNPKEPLHIELRACLDNIRAVLNETQGARTEANAKALIGRMMTLIDRSATLTEQVLKAEWTRVKQEVAYPEALMATITQPNSL
ncbi:hypothetical protein [Rhodanobacter terrae]|uniref:Uncharacterized protein n=1 Tax=Rhodanobacter terrae TaxID=418647 RepID=A0ABW0SVB8_9GAMM